MNAPAITAAAIAHLQARHQSGCECVKAARLGRGLTHCVGREHLDEHPSLHVSENSGRLLLHCHAGCCDGTALLAEARRRLAGAAPFFNTSASANAKVANRANAPVTTYITTLWRTAQPTAGTLAAAYLTSRGLTSPLPSALRFLPALKHAPSGQRLPAMLAAVTITGSTIPIALHRTYLQRDGSGKAHVEPSRMALGLVRGGTVQLAAAGARLAIAEGIETALSVQHETDIPTWAALSCVNIANILLPPLPLAAEVVIAADADAPGLRAAQAAAARWTAQGRHVRIALPPAGRDFNDVLRGAA